jgi:hypothetical protein
VSESPTKAILELYERLATMEARVSPRPAIVTGVQGVRIMRLVALMATGWSIR